MIALNSIINGDCLEVMKDIADRSIDCIICDLPYGVTACKWDVVIPFEPLWEQYKRIIKPNGAIALFGSQPFTSALVMSNPKWFKYEWIWEKSVSSGFLDANRKPLKIHENILIFYKQTPNYNPQMRKGEPYIKHQSPNRAAAYNKIKACTLINEGQRFPNTVIKIRNGNNKSSHPTQKPVPLIEYLIKTYTQEGELILDNTAGSGTLAIAAINTNRQYICIEKDPHYFEVMRDRIANHDPFAPVKTKKPKPAPKGQLTLFDGGLAV
ncbi:DNA-methyltransferase [Phormidium tenue]|uniref:Methyltransferase n=1 Tax=Phormidium tenue FACHB-1050 TaxID=2692857 RepID=A0ABR8C8L8_9CYAN|nr:site-specific DNA-methyltransferase [Phormidium tenue]MBD2316686.1 site-specific DNA-methyltransferase [Phormidium tenue FACHB-1050]